MTCFYLYFLIFTYKGFGSNLFFLKGIFSIFRSYVIILKMSSKSSIYWVLTVCPVSWVSAFWGSSCLTLTPLEVVPVILSILKTDAEAHAVTSLAQGPQLGAAGRPLPLPLSPHPAPVPSSTSDHCPSAGSTSSGVFREGGAAVVQVLCTPGPELWQQAGWGLVPTEGSQDAPRLLTWFTCIWAKKPLSPAWAPNQTCNTSLKKWISQF